LIRRTPTSLKGSHPGRSSGSRGVAESANDVQPFAQADVPQGGRRLAQNIRERMNISYLADHTEVIPMLAQWFYKEWAYLHPGKTLADVERLIGERINTNKIPLALVAFENQELIGTVSLKVNDMDTHLDLSPWLAGLYVSAPLRRKGIGATLVSAIEKKACELGIERLYLHTPESETFYSKLGWQVKERVKYHGYPVCVMQKIVLQPCAQAGRQSAQPRG